MRARNFFCLALGAGISIVGGCSVTPAPTPVTRDFGVAHELAVLGQIANPAAEENLAAVEGIDAKSALGSYNRYRAGFGYDQRTSDANQFDIRPVQENASEITIKGNSGATPNLLLQP